MMPIDGADETILNLRKVVRAAHQAAFRSIEASSKDLLQRSNDIAPQLTGRMIMTSGIDGNARRTASITGKSVTASVFYKERYALFLHEGMEPTGRRTGGRPPYKRGPITRGKPGAGGHFLKRPFDAQKEKYQKDFRNRVDRAIRIALR